MKFRDPIWLLLFTFALLLLSCAEEPSENPVDPTNPDFIITQWLRCNFFREPSCPQMTGGAGGESTGIASLAPNQVASASSLRLWLKADAGITQAGGVVSAWADQSGNGNDATQGTGASQPAYVNNGSGPNAQPMLSFDGTDDFFTYNGSFFVTSSFAIFMVNRITNPKTNNYPLGGQTQLTNQNLLFGVDSTSTGTFNFAFYANDLLWTNYASGGDDLLAGKFDLGSLKRTIYYKGSSVVSNTASSSLTSYSGSAIGRYASSYYRGFISEIIAFNVALPDSERQAIECYLSKKYGIAVAQTCL